MEQVNVAIADDNERILDLLEEIINMDKELHVVGKAKNGEEMCQIIRNKQPDVVLLDLIMPKMDGLTVMEKINQDKNVQKRPDFIVVTAVGQERITEDAFNRGANYYIMKPFNNEMLLNRIKTVRRPVRSCEKRNDELSSQVPYIREGDLENRVTNLLHEIGIPALRKQTAARATALTAVFLMLITSCLLCHEIPLYMTSMLCFFYFQLPFDLLF